MLEDSIAESTGVKEQCKEILTVVDKIYKKTQNKINMRNKVVQAIDYFPDIRQIANTKTLNWEWIKGWGRQQDAGEVITTLIGQCMENSFKQKVKNILYIKM